MFRNAVLFAVLLLGLYGAQASADPSPVNLCPKFKVLLLGDSIMAGKGDLTDRQGISGRLTESFPGTVFDIESVGGQSSFELLDHLRDKESGFSIDLKKRLQAVDVVVVSIGLNDFWLKRNPQTTVETLKEIRGVLESMRKDGSQEPAIIFTDLLPTTLASQNAWGKQVSRQMVIRGMKNRLPFSKLKLELVSQDGLHPSSLGYDWLAKTTGRYLLSLKDKSVQATCSINFAASPHPGGEKGRVPVPHGGSHWKRRRPAPPKAATL